MFASIRWRLTVWYFCSFAVISTGLAVGAWFAMGSSMLSAVDHDLQLRIDDVQQFIERQLAVSANELMDEFKEQAGLGLGGGLVEVRDGDGGVLYRSAQLGAAQLGASAASRSIEFTTRRTRDLYARVASRTINARGRRFSIRVAESLRGFEESRERFEGILVLLASAALLLAGFAGFWMSGRALAPVGRKTKKARDNSSSHR